MIIELSEHPTHTGSELYQVSFVIKDQDDLYDVRTQGSAAYTFHPEKVNLVWERLRPTSEGYGQWRRVGYRPYSAFSCISGPRVLKDGTLSDKVMGYREVFTEFGLGTPLTNYASGLPGLELVVERAEKRLPA